MFVGVSVRALCVGSNRSAIMLPDKLLHTGFAESVLAATQLHHPAVWHLFKTYAAGLLNCHILLLLPVPA